MNLMCIHLSAPLSLCFIAGDLRMMHESAFILQKENNEQEGNNELKRRSAKAAPSESPSSSVAKIELWQQERTVSRRARKCSSFVNKLQKLLSAMCLCPL